MGDEVNLILKIRNPNKLNKTSIGNNYTFINQDFRETIKMATAEDIIYCDSPYIDRYVNYYNGWNEEKMKSDLCYTYIKKHYHLYQTYRI